MCGIAGIIANGVEIPETAIEQMTQRLIHRGPDAQKWVQLRDCQLGHTRLSVIDLAGGEQPMTEENQRYWLIFNGEIYNYQQLRQDLEKKNWSFRTQSDTEVLLRGYQEYGEQILRYLNGQFAFAIWDQEERCLFAARDRLGEKPLYFACSEAGHFLIASEIQALLNTGLIHPRLDRVAVDAYLALLYVPPDRTIYENIQVLQPGHFLSWGDGRWQQQVYWQPQYSQQVLDAGETIERIYFLISQAVERQMVADVPVGAFLSGGLDSSTIVALMTQQTSQPVKTFAAGFGDLINELPYARLIAQSYQTEHHEIQIELAVGDLLEIMSRVYDEPFADSSNIPTYCLAEFARRHVKVVLSGDGGDELFGGYEWYSHFFYDRTRHLSQQNPAVLSGIALFWRGLAKLGFPVTQQKNIAVQNYQAIVNRDRYPDWWERHLAFVTDLKARRVALWGDQAPAAEAAIRTAYFPGATLKEMDRVTDFDLRCYLPGDILVKVDRAAMSHGLETRSPFLDVDLVEFVLSLPWELRFGQGELKSLLRQACSHLWTAEIQKRSKQGFGAPIANWLKRPDVQALLKRVCRTDSLLTTILPGVPRVIPASTPQEIWAILCLGLWLEQHSACLNHLPSQF